VEESYSGRVDGNMLRLYVGTPPASYCYLQGALTAAAATDQQLGNRLKYKSFIM